MTRELWAAVDEFIEDTLVHSDEALTAALIDSEHAGLMAINVSPNQGKLLHILARSIGARRMLEIGTLGAYSTIWLARALPEGGRLTTLEIDPGAAAVAMSNLARAGLADRVDVLIGPGLETLKGLSGPFDFAFIDANKDQNPEYFLESLARTRPGGLIVVDNVVRAGAVLDEKNRDPAAIGVRRLYEVMRNEPRVTVTALQTVGVKGHDGLAIALVNAP